MAITYEFSEDVDFVEKHALLVFAHLDLSEHLDRPLRAGLSVHDHAHLAESAYILVRGSLLPLPSTLPIL